MEKCRLETPFGDIIVDEETIKQIQKWQHAATQECIDEVPSLRSREISEFVADGGRMRSYRTGRRKPMGPWMLLALDAILERSFEVINVEWYAEPPATSHITPITKGIPISVNESKAVLFEATRFVIDEDGRKWAITTEEDPFCGAIYFSFETAEDDEDVDMQSIWKAMIDWLRSDSPFRGGALRADGSFMAVDKSITLEDVVLSEEVRKGITKNVCTFLENVTTFTKNGNKDSRGVLMTGPPGCGKTLTSRALVNHRGNATSIYVTSDDVREPGDLTKIYYLARRFAPTMIIIEDLDCLGGAGMDRKERHGHPLLGEFLEVLCGSSDNSQVVTVASTNHPNLLDEALIDRPGRIDVIIPVGVPDASGRRLIIQMEMNNHTVQEGIDIATLAKRTEGFTGSHLVGLVNNAALEALHRADDGGEAERELTITQADFDAALAETMETRKRASGAIMDEIRPKGNSSFAELYN